MWLGLDARRDITGIRRHWLALFRSPCSFLGLEPGILAMLLLTGGKGSHQAAFSKRQPPTEACHHVDCVGHCRSQCKPFPFCEDFVRSEPQYCRPSLDLAVWVPQKWGTLCSLKARQMGMQYATPKHNGVCSDCENGPRGSFCSIFHFTCSL